jgi:Flp pilus assembly pilin Flp
MERIAPSPAGVESTSSLPVPSCLAAFVSSGARTGRGSRVRRLHEAVVHLVRTEDGQDLLEYGMVVVLIAVAAVIAVDRVGSTINAVLWQAIAASNY